MEPLQWRQNRALVLVVFIVLGCLSVGTGCVDAKHSTVWTASSDAATGASELRAAAERWTGRKARGVYYHGKKVGFEVVEIGVEQTEQGRCLRVTTERCNRVSMFGEQLNSLATDVEWFLLEGEGPLVQYRQVSIEQGQRTVTNAIRRDGKFEIRTELAGESVVRLAELPKESLRSWIRFDEWLSPTTPVGAVFEGWTTDLEQTDVNRRSVSTLRTKPEASSGADGTGIYGVDSKIDGAIVSFRTRGCQGIESSEWSGIEAKLEPEVQARALGGVSPDLTAITVFPVAAFMGDDSTGLNRVTLRLEGLQADFVPPESGTQSVESLSPGFCRVWVAREPPYPREDPIDADARARFLRADPGIESDHPRIRGLADEVAGQAKDPVAKATLLQHWVYENVKGDFSKRANSALVVLEQRAGVCAESARLFVALARAAGVPAREVGGLLYSGWVAGGGFIGHGWAQVHDGTRWIDVDPSWDQVGVDAGHVCLQLDSDDNSFYNVLGSLHITVERFERR